MQIWNGGLGARWAKKKEKKTCGLSKNEKFGVRRALYYAYEGNKGQPLVEMLSPGGVVQQRISRRMLWIQQMCVVCKDWHSKRSFNCLGNGLNKIIETKRNRND